MLGVAGNRVAGDAAPLHFRAGERFAAADGVDGFSERQGEGVGRGQRHAHAGEGAWSTSDGEDVDVAYREAAALQHFGHVLEKRLVLCARFIPRSFRQDAIIVHEHHPRHPRRTF